MPKETFDITEPEKRRILEFLEALRAPCQVEMKDDSPYNTTEFESDFRSRLLAQHYFVGTPLFQESFDSAFLSACRQSGFDTTPAPDGQRFWDIQVNGKKISLKSTKARNLNRKKLHISKLTEAAWIQDCRTPRKRRDMTLRLFEEYCSDVNAIIQLRYFHKLHKYELVEIPVAPLFGQISDTNREDFSADGPSINIPTNKETPDFTLKLDRSDSKVTISNINKDVCIVHGAWTLNLDNGATGNR